MSTGRLRPPTTQAYPSSDYFFTSPGCPQDINFGDPGNTELKLSICASQFRFSTSPENENSISEEYQFLHHDLFSLSSEDKSFLLAKGSFSLPSRELATYFVEKFFQRIHPVAPVIDEAQFWRIWDGQSEERFSLFVFQALLFASCPFVPLQVLQKCGYTNKRDARKRLYDKAKLLFDLNAETKPSAKTQGAIFLTHHTSAEAPQAGSLWLSRAIENAMMIDSHPSAIFENFPQHLTRRIWWTILLRDRSLCIGLRRRPQVVSIDIYGCRDWLSEDDFCEELHSSKVHGYHTKIQLLIALQEQCGLAVLLTDLVSLVFTPGVTAMTKSSVAELRRNLKRVEDIKQSLVQWETKVQPPPSPDVHSTTEDAAGALRSLTFMYYRAAQVDLAQYAALLLEEQISSSTELYEHSIKQIARDLAVGISGLTDVMDYFSVNGNVEQLPLSVLAYAAMPLVLAAIDLKLSPSYRETQKRQKRLDSISRIIRHSESLYDVTDFVAVGTNQILQLAYSVTRSIFLPCASQLRISPVCDHYDLKVQKQRNVGSRVRAKCWFDAFLSCPRAYLLISTSVDYSLAVGRLPCQDSLPVSVRQLPPSSGISRLPWSASLCTENEIIHKIGRKDERNTQAHSALTKPTSTVPVLKSALNEFNYLDRNGTIHSQYKQGYQNQGLSHQNEWHTYPLYGEKYERRDHNFNIPVAVNLDFLELDGGLKSPALSPLWHSKVSDNAGFPPLASLAHEYSNLGHVDCTYPEDTMARLDAVQSLFPDLPEG
ncbi:Transcription factor [Penicillium waksmanii]|uniref:Transcription factor n=1 Tax=Penicillium waksmanii TaxID=69791 RepID=UPI002548031F|nr:Transcription factor [Penicillium waksmanii]KAJ6000853.1 Transcription factor [Penicillium waksmanii]